MIRREALAGLNRGRALVSMDFFYAVDSSFIPMSMCGSRILLCLVPYLERVCVCKNDPRKNPTALQALSRMNVLSPDAFSPPF